ncbi:EAL domain-containing protein [Rhodobacterales bacterium]|nr:EAL domain-containing protein [Rhodobacterales bacterium]
MADLPGDLPMQTWLACLSIAFAFLVIGFFAGRFSRRSVGPAQAIALDRSAILNTVVDQVHEGLVMQDIHGRIEWSNPAYSRITGYSAEEIRGRRPQEYILPDDRQMTAAEIENFQYDLNVIRDGSEELILNRRKNGELFWNQLTFATFEAARPEDTKIILICRDVSAHVQHVRALEEARNRLKHQAEHDDLTGIANRACATARLQELVAKPAEPGERIGLIHFDLDHFKDINDNHGHGAGDTVLRRAAQVLKSVVGEQGLVARMGGDEFLVVIDGAVERPDLEALGEGILKGLARPVKVDLQLLRVSGSVGLTLADRAEAGVSELILRSDLALYAAKRAGRNMIAWYTDALGAENRYRRMTMARLDQDLLSGNLTILMQPQYCLQQDRITSYEVTVHWLHPSEGLVNPASYLSSKEVAYQMFQIERFAIERGLAEMQQLRELSGHPVGMSVNLSEASLKDKNLAERLVNRCAEAGLSPQELVIELDEKAVLFDTPGALRTAIERLREAGFQIALDSFGSGHGGGGQLIHLPFDLLKITPGLIDGIESEPVKRQLVNSVIQLAVSLNVNVAAVGVDGPGQLCMLKEMGCRAIQGGVVSAPLIPREAELHLREFSLSCGETELEAAAQ